MDRGKRPNNSTSSRNSKIHYDLKDIIRESALPFLPAKSLSRFQAVCREWKLQISAPFFAHTQSLYFRDSAGFFLQSPGNRLSFITIDQKSCGVPDPSLKFLPGPFDIRASSNGLLCCLGLNGDKSYYICNPATKQWKKLPKSSADHGSNPAVVLIFEPSLLNFVADYKLVVGFPSADFDNATEFEIYSSNDQSWKISGEICFDSMKLVSRSGVHVNGVVYWQSKLGGFLAYDLKKDRSQLIQGLYGLKGCFGVMGGKLCTAYASGPSVTVNVLSNIYSNTMQMCSKTRTWEEKYRSLLDNEVIREHVLHMSKVLFVGRDWVLVQLGKRIYSHDLKTQETKLIEEAADSELLCVSYVNSLVSI